MSDDDPIQSLCGWRGIDDTQKLFASQFPQLRQAAPHLFGAPTPTDPVLLYKAWSDVLGKYPDYPAQQIGDCVSFGHGHGNDLLQCIEIRLGGPVSLPRDRHRVHLLRVARGRRHSGDKRRVVRGGGGQGDDDDRDGLARDARAPTVRIPAIEPRNGGRRALPMTFELKAAPYKLGSAALVSTWDDLVAAITNGYPVTICTDQGFTLDA